MSARRSRGVFRANDPRSPFGRFVFRCDFSGVSESLGKAAAR